MTKLQKACLILLEYSLTVNPNKLLGPYFNGFVLIIYY